MEGEARTHSENQPQPGNTVEPQPEANWSYTGASEEFVGQSMADQDPVQMDLPEESLSWSAQEYIAHEKGPLWLITFLLGAALVTIIAFFVSRDIFVTISTAIVGIAAAVFSMRQPKEQDYAISASGVKVGDRQFSYSDFKSFSVVEEGQIDSIWLKPVKRFAPMVVIYFKAEDEQAIASLLSHFLPYEDRGLDTIDIVSRKLKF